MGNIVIQVNGNIAGDGRRYDFSVPEPRTPAVGGYSDTNASVSYSLNARTGLYARAGNLLNSKFHDYIGFPNPGIIVRVGLTWSPFAH